MIHLDPAKMSVEPADGSAQPPGPSVRIERGPGLPDKVVQRLLCDGRVRTLLMKDEHVLDVGRSHRLVTKGSTGRCCAGATGIARGPAAPTPPSCTPTT